MQKAVEQLAGSTGIAEYYRILREHGVDHPKGFKTTQPARLCAKEVFGLLEELRRNAQENQEPFQLVRPANTDESQSALLEVG